MRMQNIVEWDCSWKGFRILDIWMTYHRDNEIGIGI